MAAVFVLSAHGQPARRVGPKKRHKKGQPRKVARSKRVPVDPSWIVFLGAVPARHGILPFRAHRHAWGIVALLAQLSHHNARFCLLPALLSCSCNCIADALPGILPVPLLTYLS